MGGQTAAGRSSRTTHRDGILRLSLAPAPGLSRSCRRRARRSPPCSPTALDHVGVLTVELFERDGELLVNELAPRVHNSGHWTIEGAETSQFENHLRAVLGWPARVHRDARRSCARRGDGQLHRRPPRPRRDPRDPRRAPARLRQDRSPRAQGRPRHRHRTRRRHPRRARRRACRPSSATTADPADPGWPDLDVRPASAAPVRWRRSRRPRTSAARLQQLGEQAAPQPARRPPRRAFASGVDAPPEVHRHEPVLARRRSRPRHRRSLAHFVDALLHVRGSRRSHHPAALPRSPGIGRRHRHPCTTRSSSHRRPTYRAPTRCHTPDPCSTPSAAAPDRHPSTSPRRDRRMQLQRRRHRVSGTRADQADQADRDDQDEQEQDLAHDRDGTRARGERALNDRRNAGSLPRT